MQIFAHAPSGTHTKPGKHTNFFFALGVGVLFMLSSLFTSMTPAHAHDELVGIAVIPDTSTTVTGFGMIFNNEVIDAGVEITVVQGGNDVTDGAPVVSGRNVTQSLVTPLNEGDYNVAWRVVSSDGHPIQGQLLLQIAADGTGVISVVTPGDDHDHAADDHADHDHDDHGEGEHGHGDEQPEVTTQNTDEGSAEAGLPWWLWALIGVGVLGVAGAVITSSVVGAKRRRESMGEVIGGSTESANTESDHTESESTEPDHTEEGK